MSNENNAPTHIVYISTGKNRKTGKDNLSRVGALWPHQTGTGFNLRLKATSNNGEYIIFENKKESNELASMAKDRPALNGSSSPDATSPEFDDDIPF